MPALAAYPTPAPQPSLSRREPYAYDNGLWTPDEGQAGVTTAAIVVSEGSSLKATSGSLSTASHSLSAETVSGSGTISASATASAGASTSHVARDVAISFGVIGFFLLVGVGCFIWWKVYGTPYPSLASFRSREGAPEDEEDTKTLLEGNTSLPGYGDSVKGKPAPKGEDQFSQPVKMYNGY